MFHANTLENTKDIVGKSGINPTKGRINCDFGAGFYLTGDYSHAVEWAKTHNGYTNSAVVIYMVPTIPPNFLNGIDLSAADAVTTMRWRNLVSRYRRQEVSGEVDTANRADWIYGLEAQLPSARDLQDPGWEPAPLCN